MQKPQEPFTLINVEEAKRLIDEGRVKVIDVREPDEWRWGHIPVATHIPLGKIVNQPLETLTLDKDQPILFVCAAGPRSGVACEVAAAMGYTELYNLQGGTLEWVKAGHPVELGD